MTKPKRPIVAQLQHAILAGAGKTNIPTQKTEAKDVVIQVNERIR
jgi:hypothetical protein